MIPRTAEALRVRDCQIDVSATQEEIQPRPRNAEKARIKAICSFELERKAPYKIKGIGVDIGNVER